jgi:hypothetical protein
VDGVPEVGVEAAPVLDPVWVAAPLAVLVVGAAGVVLAAVVEAGVVAVVVDGLLLGAEVDCTVLRADELGAVMFAIARPRSPRPCGERKVICVGVAMTIPMLAAIRSILVTDPSDATCARS